MGGPLILPLIGLVSLAAVAAAHCCRKVRSGQGLLLLLLSSHEIWLCRDQRSKHDRNKGRFNDTAAVWQRRQSRACLFHGNVLICGEYQSEGNRVL